MKPETRATRKRPPSPDHRQLQPAVRSSLAIQAENNGTNLEMAQQNEEALLTFEKLVDIASNIDPTIWLVSVTFERKAVLFYQLNWAEEAVPKIAKSVAMSWTGSQDNGGNEDAVLTPVLCIGEKRLDATCGLLILGHKDIRNEDDVHKLLEHVNQCPAAEVVQEMGRSALAHGLPINSLSVTQATLPVISAEQARDLLLQSLPRVETLSDPASMTAGSFLPPLRRPAPLRSLVGLNGFLEESSSSSQPPTFLNAGAAYSRKRKPVECDICHQIYSTKHSMLLHRQSQHEHVRHTCEYCERSFSYKYDLYTHMTKAHPEIEGLGANCEVCGVLTHFAVLEGHQKKCGRKAGKQVGGS